MNYTRFNNIIASAAGIMLFLHSIDETCWEIIKLFNELFKEFVDNYTETGKELDTILLNIIKD